VLLVAFKKARRVVFVFSLMLIEVVILLSLPRSVSLDAGFVRIAGQRTPHREDRLRAAPIGTPSVGSPRRPAWLQAILVAEELKVHANRRHSKFVMWFNRL